MNREKRVLLRAKRFIHENLALCCEELIDSSKTGILKNGCVREAASLITALPVDATQAMDLAQNMVKDAAIRFVVTRSK